MDRDLAHPLIDASATFRTIAASPDGARIAYAGNDRGIAVIDSDGSDQHWIAGTRFSDSDPAWSPVPERKP